MIIMPLDNVREIVELRGDSKLDDETVIASFTARNIRPNSTTNITTTEQDELINENRDVVRQDKRAFQDKVWEIEDRLAEAE